MQGVLATVGPHPPSSLPDADMCVPTITSVMSGAVKAASPEPRRKWSKKGFPIWNDMVSATV